MTGIFERSEEQNQEKIGFLVVGFLDMPLLNKVLL